ncbi:MAG: anthranilate synthase component I [Verrucomicrobiota bacterium]
MVFPSEDEFVKLAKQGNLIPVYREIYSDLETPVSAYMKLKADAEIFLLESVEREERFGRYSFLGTNPTLVFQQREREVTLTDHGKVKKYETSNDPLDEIKKILGKYRPVGFDKLPIFYGGMVGFLAYEAVRFFEPTVGAAKKDDLKIPDAYFILTDSMLIFDHFAQRVKVLANAFVEGDPKKCYQQAVKKIDAMIEKLKEPVSHKIIEAAPTLGNDVQSSANMTHDEYLKMTAAMKEYIMAGDFFQIVPSQRFHVPYEGTPLDLYRVLRFINPSPYMFCLEFGDVALVGASPETHVRCENGNVQIRPLAGTRPRRADAKEDKAMEEELLSDPKERAEHVMLVDLARNDVGRVCEYHSVKVTELMVVERYSHVMHISSNVEGKLKPEYDMYDVMRATFPAGTVSGAPKIRAMQVIAEQEPTRRGAYSGVVGYFGFSGNLDSCITLRTITLKNGNAYVQAGGGLVADSTPEGEYQESVNKAKAALKAVALAKTFEEI